MEDQISAWISVWNETNHFVTKSLRISISYVTGNRANWRAAFWTKNNSSEIFVGNVMLGELFVPGTSVFRRQPQ
jgi:hypothetical protein